MYIFLQFVALIICKNYFLFAHNVMYVDYNVTNAPIFLCLSLYGTVTVLKW